VIAATRKDIECVFGILKQRFELLKNWTKVRKQAHIDHAFVTCCIIHNMFLAYDGYLEPDKDIAPVGVAMVAASKKITSCAKI